MVCVKLVLLRILCRKSRCFLGKFTHLKQILHDRRSWRSRQISTLSGSSVALFDMPNLNRFDILSISIFCKIALSISISISIFSKITISISISISIFLELPYRYRYRYRYFSELPYRYRYFSKVSIYRQSICHIDISNRATVGWEHHKTVSWPDDPV